MKKLIKMFGGIVIFLSLAFVFFACKSQMSFSFLQNKGILTVGQKVNLYDYISTNVSKDKIILESSNSDIISVNESGIIEAINKGSSTITATLQEKTFSIDIEAIQNVNSFQIPETLDTETDQILTIDYQLYPSNANNKQIVWSTSDPTIATIEDGVIVTKKIGKCLITGRSESGNFTSTCELNVKWNGLTTEEVFQENGVYKISNASQLKWMANYLYEYDYTNINIELEADIDLNNKEWTPIGYRETNIFKNTFNGNGYFIKNLNITNSNIYYGFFAINNGLIKNLSIDGKISINENTETSVYCGGIAGSSNGGTIEACNNYSEINNKLKISTSCLIGGIVGSSTNTKFINCNNYGKLCADSENLQSLLLQITISGISCGNVSNYFIDCNNAGEIICDSKSNNTKIAGISYCNSPENMACIFDCENVSSLVLLQAGTKYNLSNKNVANKDDVSTQQIFDFFIDMDLFDNITITGEIIVDRNLTFGINSVVVFSDTSQVSITSGTTLCILGTLINNGKITVSGTKLVAYNLNENFDELYTTLYETEENFWKVAYTSNASIDLTDAHNYQQNGEIELLSHSDNKYNGSSYQTAIEYVLTNNTINTASGVINE